MKDFEIIRAAFSPDHGVFGVFKDPDRIPFAVTVERPWLENKSGVSCIPEGVYICKRTTSPKFGDVFEVTGVPGRTHILIHKANRAIELEGCIAVGEQFEMLDGKPAIIESGKAFGEFMFKLKSEVEFRLAVKNRWE